MFENNYKKTCVIKVIENRIKFLYLFSFFGYFEMEHSKTNKFETFFDFFFSGQIF